jgi:hypothetical protein
LNGSINISVFKWHPFIYELTCIIKHSTNSDLLSWLTMIILINIRTYERFETFLMIVYHHRFNILYWDPIWKWRNKYVYIYIHAVKVKKAYSSIDINHKLLYIHWWMDEHSHRKCETLYAISIVLSDMDLWCTAEPVNRWAARLTFNV